MKQGLIQRRWIITGALAATLGLLSGCSTPARHADTAAPVELWSGRLALQLQDDAAVDNRSPQSFSAAFELQGSPDTGSLQLFTPLGSSVALIRWQPEGAWLQQGQQERSSPSLEVLVRDALGTAIPIPALFAWIQGRDQAAEGWSVDLSRYVEGRIAAQRHHPTPRASLRLILDR